MHSNTLEVRKHNSVTKKNYIIDDFTQDMIMLLPKSPKSFTHILTLAITKVFAFSEDEVHEAISRIASVIPQDKLNKYLAEVNPEPVVKLVTRPDIKQDVMAFINHNEVHMAMFLARHLYGDLSETENEQRISSQQALASGQGHYVTHFRYHSRSVCVETNLMECTSTVCLI